MRSNDTSPFAQMVAQLFSSASNDQKAVMLNALLSWVGPDQRAEFEALIPGTGALASVPGDRAALVPPAAIQTLAQRGEQHAQQDPTPRVGDATSRPHGQMRHRHLDSASRRRIAIATRTGTPAGVSRISWVNGSPIARRRRHGLSPRRSRRTGA
jgi:hypothetical protein